MNEISYTAGPARKADDEGKMSKHKAVQPCRTVEEKVWEPPVIRVIVVDSSRMNAQAISAALVQHQFEVVHAGCDPAEAMTEAARLRPDIALIGEQLDGQRTPGFELAEAIRGAYPQLQVIMILERSDPESVTQAFRAGARGIFCRSSLLESLVKCITCVHQGQLWASSLDLEHLVGALKMPLRLVNSKGADLLSKREGEVVQRASEGLTNREIANLLGLSENTVKNYIYRIFDKLGISSRVELVLYAVSQLAQRSPKCDPVPDPPPAFNDHADIFRWFGNAAERLIEFQYVLGKLCREGYGAQGDRRAAYLWFCIAEKLSAELVATSRRGKLQVSTDLGSKEISAVAREAADWVKRQRESCSPGAHRVNSSAA